MDTRRITAVVLAAALLAAACGSSDDDTEAAGDQAAATTSTLLESTSATTVAPAPETTQLATTTTEAPAAATTGALVADAPEGLDFYTPPDPLPGETGDLIWSREHGPVDGGTAHLILYRSEKIGGDPIAVSGLLFVPDQEAPPEGRPIFSWGNGTRGLADECANSRADDPTAAIPILTGLLERNIVVVATDYEGLGTPGIHPYTIGASEARGMLDAIRATLQFEPAEATGPSLLGGQSQGGQAQAFANQISADYAPELEILASIGTSAGVVKADTGIVNFLINTPDFMGIMVMAMAAQQAAYGPELAPPTRLLTDLGVAELPNAEVGCAGEVGQYFAQFSTEELFLEDWDLSFTDGSDAATLNEAGNDPNSVPQLLLHTSDDGLVPAAFVAQYLDLACTHGMPIAIEWWDGGHSLIYDSADAQDRALAWVDDTLAGVDPVDHCADIPQPG